MTAPSPATATGPGSVPAGAFDVVDLIRTKRDGGTLEPAAVDWVIAAYTDGLIAEEQMSALAMAILFRGLDRTELSRWTAAMIASGERLDFSGLSRPTVDKHSTGGVGDKITLQFPASRSVRHSRHWQCTHGVSLGEFHVGVAVL